METKSSIRKQMLALRDEMSCEERMIYSKEIMDTLLELDVIQQAKEILCFVGYKSEVSTTALMEELLLLDKKIYVPRVNGEEMDFYRIKNLKDLQEGYKAFRNRQRHVRICLKVLPEAMW